MTADNNKQCEPLVSVIVPTHNLADCVGMCLDSLKAQTFEGFEVICVDDASTDDTYEVLQGYAADERIRVVRLDEDLGASVARNAGVEEARGKLVSFVDGDDFVSPHYLQVLYEAWVSSPEGETFVKAKNVRGPREVVAKTQWRPYAEPEARAIPSEEAIRELLLERMTVVAWACLAPRELYLRHPFPVGMVFEDHYVIIDHLQAVEHVMLVDTPVYAYVRRDDSLSNPMKHDAGYVHDMMTVVGHLLEQSWRLSEELHDPLSWACAWRLALAVSYCSDIDDKSAVRDDCDFATRYLRAHLRAIIRVWRREKLDRGQLVKILVAASSPRIYWKTRSLFRAASGADRKGRS